MAKKEIKEITIRADFGKKVGKVKAMHGIGQPPHPAYNTHYHYLSEAGIPYSRLHDVGGWLGGGLYVDIPNIFKDFDADVNDPASYDFAFTDRLIGFLMEAKCEPYFRLGVSIENLHTMKYYRLDPPKDNQKWAEICEHIIAHYNEGWADGFEYGITYWEIWNEPDDCFKEKTAAMWKGTPEQYYKLYSVTAKHLKARFGDKIKVGAYGHCGLYEHGQDKELEGIGKVPEKIYEFVIEFMHGFFRHLKSENAPLDFFSWHVYDNCHASTFESFRPIAKHAEYIRKILDHYGYTNAEHHLNEWNLWTKGNDRDNPIAAAKSLAFMLMMQNTSTDIMCFYDGRMGCGDYASLFNPDTQTPYRCYYAFAEFNSMYKLGEQVFAESDDEDVFVGAAVNGVKGVLLISNVSGEVRNATIDIESFATDDTQVLIVDRDNRYTLTGKDIAEGKLMLSPYSCTEIKLLDLSKR